eukprot:3751009-Rhodomonas_salina.1
MGDSLPEHIRNDIHKLIAASASANRVQAYGSTCRGRPRNALSTTKRENAADGRKQVIRRPQTASPGHGLGPAAEDPSAKPNDAARSVADVQDSLPSHKDQPADQISAHARRHEPAAVTPSPTR